MVNKVNQIVGGAADEMKQGSYFKVMLMHAYWKHLNVVNSDLDLQITFTADHQH